MYVHLLRGNRDLFVAALGGSSRAASGRPEAVADDERGKEVRLADSTCEAGEQSGTSRGELVEGSGGTKRNVKLQSTVRTQSREAVSQAQDRIHGAVTRDKKEKLTALARRFLDAMRERLQEFSLSLHPDKTRLIGFGRFA